MRCPTALRITGFCLALALVRPVLADGPLDVKTLEVDGLKIRYFVHGGVGQWRFAQIGKNDPNADALAVCGRSLSKLALNEDQIKAIKVPVSILVGDDDQLIKKLYVEPAQSVRKDWPIVEIRGEGHLTCIVKPQFRDELQKWLDKNHKIRPEDKRAELEPPR